ncbi:hypothetical protein PR202_gb28820 [Eleusine coracana subsp. coracana]|uniref:F-box domain-containing protein n=1 Tax=Eleusine coracana subsp. coracana TaxID=191504 RepID=A0AAV5FYY4_ELECO|nr:hypothetical protein PR202_gb28820 [Eleusine coracana subsp. coracana]
MPSMEEAVYPDWSGLPEDLMANVMRVLDIPHMFSAGTVCTSWYAAYSAVLSFRIPIKDAHLLAMTTTPPHCTAPILGQKRTVKALSSLPLLPPCYLSVLVSWSQLSLTFSLLETATRAPTPGHDPPASCSSACVVTLLPPCSHPSTTRPRHHTALTLPGHVTFSSLASVAAPQGRGEEKRSMGSKVWRRECRIHLAAAKRRHC